MNTTRKADLQRKLAMMEVPKPPAGLADRIKNDIPANIGAAPVRGTRRFGFAMRIAASLVVVISSVWIGTRFLSDKSADIPMAMAKRAAQPAAAPAESAKVAQNIQQAAAPAATPRADSVSQAEAGAAEQQVAPSAPARIAETRPTAKDDAKKSSAAQPEATIAYAPPPPLPPAPAAVAPEPVLIAPQQPARVADGVRTAAAPAAAPIAVQEAKAAPRGQQITREEAAAAAKVAAAERDAAVSEVVGGVLANAPRAKTEAIVVSGSAPPAKIAAGAVSGALVRSRFGISTDPLVVERIRQALERGERPDDVNVEALVNYFAGGSEESVAAPTIELEGSPAPVSVNALTRLVRVSVDAPMSSGSTARRVASGVELAVKFDSTAVASYRLIGGTELSKDPEDLYENNSVTALFEVQMKPGVRNRQQIVKTELRYRDPAGHTRVFDRALKYGDFRQVWPDASRRHRLASLGAIWGETLKYDTSGTDVAKRAEELAKQEPGNSKARELAQLATASSRLRSSGPTGSGR